MFPEHTDTVVDCGSELAGIEQRDRGKRNRGDESRWKGRKHEAGMTSLGLTFHSRPTPALCILTSLRCVSYILYLTPPLPPVAWLVPFLHRIPLTYHCSTWLLQEWKGRKDGEMRKNSV